MYIRRGRRVARGALGLAVVAPPIGLVRSAAVPPVKRTVRAAGGSVNNIFAMSGISSQPYGPPVYRGAMGIFGDDTDPITTPTLVDPATKSASVSDKLDQIIARQEDETRARKMSQLVAIGGALFAAFRLGIIALPHLKKKFSPGES